MYCSRFIQSWCVILSRMKIIGRCKHAISLLHVFYGAYNAMHVFIVTLISVLLHLHLALRMYAITQNISFTRDLNHELARVRSCKPVLSKTLIFKLRHEVILGLDGGCRLASIRILVTACDGAKFCRPTIEHYVMENKFSLL